MNTKKTDLFSTLLQMGAMSLRYLAGRRLRTALTTLAIVFGVALIFSINVILPTLTNVFKQSSSGITGADIQIGSVSGEGFAPDEVLAQVANVAQVQAVTGILRRQYSVPSLGSDGLGSTPQIELIGLDLNSATNVRQFNVSEGRFLEAGDRGKAILPAGIADLAPELKVGTTFPLITAGGLRVYTVVGMLAEEGNPSAPQIYVSLEDAQSAFNQAGLINTIEVSVEAGADIDATATAILETLGSGFELNASNSATDTFAALQVGFAVYNMFGVLALFLGAFLIFNTFRTVVIERRRDIGMLRTIGATQQQILMLIVIESLVQGILGTIIGLGLGYLMTIGMAKGMESIVVNYLHMSSFDLNFSPNAFIMAISLGLLTALLAGYFPARSASKTSPLEALRPSTTASIEKANRLNLIIGGLIMVVALIIVFASSQAAIMGALLFLIGMVIAAPAFVIPVSRWLSPLLTLWFAREGDLAQGNLARQPGRAAITGSTMMIGLAVLVMMAALVSGFDGLIKDLANDSFSSDILLMPQSLGIYTNVIGADESLAERIRAVDAVETASGLRYAAANVGGTGLQVLGIDPVNYPKLASFTFNEGTDESVFADLETGRNAVLTSLAMKALNLQMGDDFVLETAQGQQTYHVVGVANDFLTFKISSIFVSQANLAADFHKEEDIMLLVNLNENADADIQTIVQDYPQFTAHLTGEYRQEIIDLSTGYLFMFYALAALILIPAVLGLLNTLSINIMERTREIGVIRAIGGSRAQVQRIVAGEALLLGIFSAAMGILSGVILSYGFISIFGSIGWQMPYIFPTVGVIAAFVIGVLLALLASILPARNAAKLDIIRALQYE